MTYVDLNPIRAQMTKTPESSDYTSVQKRIKAADQGKTPSLLMPFTGNEHQAKPTNGIPFALKDKLELVEATGQIARKDKRGKIDDTLPPILKRLIIDASTWQDIALNFESTFGPLALGPTANSEQRTANSNIGSVS